MKAGLGRARGEGDLVKNKRSVSGDDAERKSSATRPR